MDITQDFVHDRHTLYQLSNIHNLPNNSYLKICHSFSGKGKSKCLYLWIKKKIAHVRRLTIKIHAYGFYNVDA